jgi:uncharacterized protein YqeY
MPTPDPTDVMRARLKADLRAAMKARDAVKTGVLRCLIAALDNAGAITPEPTTGPARFAGSEHVATRLAWGSAEAMRRSLSATEVDALIAREVTARRDAATEFERCGRSLEAEGARAEMAIAARYGAPTDEE